MSAGVISPAELNQLSQQGKQVNLIDVRTPVEFRGAHVAFARNIPLDALDAAVVSANALPDEPVYLVCQSGGRSRQAVEKLQRAGFTRAIDVTGGTQACIAAGLPIVRGQAVISLERQVRIAAGSLVLLGVALGWWVHPAFFGLAAFVGAGLVFAGLSDTCGMGMMLARMPWNRGPSTGESCAIR